MSQRDWAWTDENECVYRARHLVPRIWVDKSGQKQGFIDWTDQASRRPGEAKRHHDVAKSGWFGPCRVCGRPALMKDCQGHICHKVCAEGKLLADS